MTAAATATGPSIEPSRRVWTSWDMCLLGFVLILLLMAQEKFNNAITSDGCVYFSYLRSLVFDHDLQIGPEVAFLNLPPRPHYVVPVGPAIIWAPAYLLVALVDWIGAVAGWWTRSDGVALGLTGGYVRAAVMSSFAAGAIGLVVLHLRVKREFDAAVALMTSILILGATTLIWYIVAEPSMTHAASFGAVALLLITTERWLVARVPTSHQAIALGTLCSLVILVRPQDGLFLAYPAAALLFAPACSGTPIKARGRIVAWLAAGAAPLFVLGVAMLLAIAPAGGFTLIGGNEGYLTPTESRWSDVLFSSRHGLFSWTPAVWLGLSGTVLYVRRNRLWAIPALAAFVGIVWTNGSAHDWAGGWAFGGRRFTSALAAFAPGFALAIDWLRRHPLVILAPAVVLTIGWNTLLMVQYQSGLLPRDESVRFDTMIRQQVDLYLKAPYAYPFAFPANVWFAWREGLPIDRYDLLGPEALRTEMYLPLNPWGARFLMGGWDDGGGDPFGSRHYLNAQSGTILVPLDVPPDVEYSLDIQARAEGGPAGRTATLGLSVNDRPFGDIALDAGAATPTRKVFTTPPGARVWRRGYNRVTLSRHEDSKGVPIAVYALRLGPAPQPPVR